MALLLFKSLLLYKPKFSYEDKRLVWGHHAYRLVDVGLRCDCDPALLTGLAEMEEEMTHQIMSSHISVAGGHAHCMLEGLQSRSDVIKKGTSATLSDRKYFLQLVVLFSCCFLWESSISGSPYPRLETLCGSHFWRSALDSSSWKKFNSKLLSFLTVWSFLLLQ